MRSMALALPQPATTNDGNSRNLLDAWDKLHRIAVRIDDEFHKVVQNQAQQIATSDPATFDIRAFVTSWKQEFEGYRSSTEAVSTFGDELNEVIGGYAGSGSGEFVQAAQQKRDELQTLLDKRNQVDTVIEEQIKALDALIGYPSGATQTATPQAAQQALIQIAQKATKRAAQKATKNAAPQAGKQPAKQAAAKAAKQTAKKASKQAAKKGTKKAGKKAGKKAPGTP
jgi:hypothetical protein